MKETEVNNPFVVGKYLSDRDLLTQKDNGYRVYDFFLAEWLSSVY